MTDRPDRGEIHLGDLARALATLSWKDEAHAARIAACLGFGLGPAQAISRAASEPTRIFDARSAGEPPMPLGAVRAEPPVLLPPAPQAPPVLPQGTLPSRLEPMDGRAPPAGIDTDWLDDPGPDSFPPEKEAAVARSALFPERTHRHILSAALASSRPGADIAMPRLVDAICRREALSRLPRRPETTLERGCQLLLDYSASMVPFWDDLTGLIDQVCGVVGADATRIYSFDTRSLEARRWTPAGEPEPWRPDGRPVLAASDLSIQGRAVAAAPHGDWTRLAACCAAAGSPLLILIPWPESQWPQRFPGSVALIHWGPRTTAGMLRRHLRGIAR
jgi:hypothetical protein